MVGVPTSNRCTFCKLRKTKCDENWPTCSTCARAGKVCSGARNSFKFVVNGSHHEAESSSPEEKSSSLLSRSAPSRRRYQIHQLQQQANSDPQTELVNLRTYAVRGGKGGTFYRMKLSRCFKSSSSTPMATTTTTPTPFPSVGPPLTSLEILSSRLIVCLEAAPGTGNDLGILGASLRMLPRHLCCSPSRALENAIELVVNSWTNSQTSSGDTMTAMDPGMWLDLRVYNKALRSLQLALDDVEQVTGAKLGCSTVAALSLLQKVELIYDFDRGANQENHAAGLTAVISKTGPYQEWSEFGLHLTFESMYNMLQEDVRLGRESVFAYEGWKTALRQEVESSSLQSISKKLYLFWIEATGWPTLVKLTRSICRDPTDVITATELIFRGTPLLEYILHKGETAIQSFMASGDIAEVENDISADLFPTRYEFCNFETAHYFCMQALFGIIICRMLQHANLVLLNDVPHLTRQRREFSRRILMTYPWMRGMRPLAIEFTGALAFAYESANSEERRYCIEALEEMEYYRRPPPIGLWQDATIMANINGYTGRIPFIKTQDVNVELQGMGCRC
ncbi:hypothetical protein F4778DRAFT_773278 [Xylariomycetidae sp. FL2044]|nr:hypothetical protein F4778DRAFT_773278 [Xylariomycetidae sp. FL2044]